MDRRSFLKTGGTVVAAATLASTPLALAEAKALAAGRTVKPINRNWRYSPKATAAAHQPGFDDSSFSKVVVPHSNIPCPGTV